VYLENGEALEADAVILATPAYITAQLVDDLDPDMATALRGIPYASTITLSVAYPLSGIPKPLNAYGYIIPRAEGRSILACTWTSTKFPHRAPDGYGLIRASWRAGDDDVLNRTDGELLQMVRDELRDVLASPPSRCSSHLPLAASHATIHARPPRSDCHDRSAVG
jgi:oxygen-dependent protoporphyrinogen oxidase